MKSTNVADAGNVHSAPTTIAGAVLLVALGFGIGWSTGEAKVEATCAGCMCGAQRAGELEADKESEARVDEVGVQNLRTLHRVRALKKCHSDKSLEYYKRERYLENEIKDYIESQVQHDKEQESTNGS